jgi:PAS domain S-box-containing protein
MEYIKILLIEDDSIDQMAFKRLVKQQNLPYQYTIVTSVAETQQLLKSNDFDFDAVLSDYHLGDGFALDFLADIIKTNIPVIITTGSGDENVAVKAMKLGAYDYIIKDPERNYLTILPVTVENAISHKKNETQSKLLSHAFKNVQDLVYITDQNNRIIFVNQSFCDAYHYQEEELLHKTAEFLYFQPQDIEKKEIFSIDNGELKTETNGLRKDNSFFPISLSKTTFHNNNALNIVYIIRDITEQKQAEEKLKASLAKEKEINELKTSFVSMVSHDFRSPLSGILSSIDFLEYYQDTLAKEDYSEYFALIRSTCNNMLQLLEDLLVIGRSETGKIKLEPKLINLEEVCRQIIAEVQFSDQQNHVINFEYTDLHQHNIYLDYKGLRHILINLLSNAVKYSPEKTTVEFNILLDNNMVIFKIKDQGIGVPLEEQTHLFESFFRAKNVNKIQGTGLGLAIVNKYINLMQGTIKFESQLNKGTTFYVKIPLITKT